MGGRWEGASRGMEHMHTYGWFMLMYGRNQHNIANNYPPIKNKYFGHLMQRAKSLEKTLMLGKMEGKEEKGVTEDEMVGWQHWLNGHEFEQTLRDSEGQGGLACCSPWSYKVGQVWASEQKQEQRGGEFPSVSWLGLRFHCHGGPSSIPGGGTEIPQSGMA